MVSVGAAKQPQGGTYCLTTQWQQIKFVFNYFFTTFIASNVTPILQREVMKIMIKSMVVVLISLKNPLKKQLKYWLQNNKKLKLEIVNHHLYFSILPSSPLSFITYII